MKFDVYIRQDGCYVLMLQGSAALAGVLAMYGPMDFCETISEAQYPLPAIWATVHNELARYASPHEWWQVATLPDGEPVGFVIPAHNGYNPIIAYVGVVPAHRGRGYIHDVLAAGTRLLAGQGVPRIRAATDVGNAPMAAAFARAGYVTFERQIDLVWS